MQRFVDRIASPAYVVRFTDDRGTIEYWNPGSEREIGWTAEEAIGYDIEQRLPSVPGRRDRLHRIRQTGLFLGTVELLNRWGIRDAYLAAGARLPGPEERYLAVLRHLPQIAGFDPTRLVTVASEALTDLGAGVAGWAAVTGHPDLRGLIQANVLLARELAALTQEELATKIGVRDPREIGRYEHGRRSPGGNRLAAIAAATGQKLGWFFEDHTAERNGNGR